ncbi:hypothetical protein ES705_25224 [subsurface metagenome]
MADLGPGQRPIIMPSYPHLLAEDTQVWTKYLKSPITDMKRVWYDLHVGAPVWTGPGANAIDKKIAAGLTKKRIDVVASVGGGYWVIELKSVGNMFALGQALAYSRLFKIEFNIYEEVWPVVICDDLDLDLIDDYDINSVALIEV